MQWVICKIEIFIIEIFYEAVGYLLEEFDFDSMTGIYDLAWLCRHWRKTDKLFFSTKGKILRDRLL